MSYNLIIEIDQNHQLLIAIAINDKRQQNLRLINKKSNAGMLNAKNQEINLTYWTTMRHNNCSLSNEHRHLKDEIKILKRQNDKLRKDFYRIENAMHEVYKSKKKYKNRYKEIKQKYDIMMEVKKTCGSKDRKQFVDGDDYQQGQYNVGVRFDGRSQFMRQNPGNFVKRHDMTSNTLQTKQDLTSHTLHTMPSSRKSQSKGLLHKTNNSRKLKQSSVSQSQVKDVGKIFSFKSQQKQRFRYQSSGSEGEGEMRGMEYGVYGQPILRQEKYNVRETRENKKRNPLSPSIYQTKTQYIQEENYGSLKGLIQHLIVELHSFSRLQNQQKTLQKQIQLMTTQGLLSQKLQQVCKKLTKIQTNQQALIVKMSSSNEYHIKESPQKQKNKKGNTHLTTSSGDRMNASFLKTIEDIGRDLSEWKIDYVGAGKK